ncbi:ABC transporter permease [Aerococcaceae bacterium NML201296]|nr:ABC transporter permease [Aerococcaceae bacterium NML201296]
MLKVTTKLAISNLLKNRQLYLPFTLASLTVVVSLYIFLSLMLNPSVLVLRGGTAIRRVLELGIVIVFITSFIVIVYANSFVMKNRTKELGLYTVLGLEKRHLHVMMLTELTLFAALTTGVGILIGVFLDKIAFAALLKMMHLPVKIIPTFQWHTVIGVSFSFLVIYAIVLILNIIRVQRLKSIDLLKESKRGEKEVKFLKTQTLLGLLTLGAAYYLAQTVTHPIKSLPTFFSAVLLVVVATYILFNAGSITFLKALKRNPHYYYQPQNFISVSNLIFRMRKNAAGLATICLLSTMALVTVVGGSVLYVGSEDTIRQYVPHHFNLEASDSFGTPERNLTEVAKQFQDFAQQKGLAVQAIEPIKMMQFFGSMNEDHLELLFDKEMSSHQLPSTEIRVVDLETYNRLTQSTETLNEHEILLYNRNETASTGEMRHLLTEAFTIKTVLKEDPLRHQMPDSASNAIADFNVMVVPSLTQLTEAVNALESKPFGFNTYYVGFNTTASRAEQLALFEEWDAQADYGDGIVQSQAEYADGYYGVVGSAFFVGAFLAILFVISMVLVIYYKQLSEGFEDRSQFEIMQKVGLDQQMIKRTVRKQMLIVFFMPAILAVIHLAFAYKNLTLILFMMSINNQALMLSITSITCIIFVISYCFIYWLTSKQYEHIVTV